MIRRVAFAKAVLAGAIGAVAWELAMRLLIWSGVPAFDLVRLLGTILLPDAPAWQWWLVGLCLHAAVGTIWAVFYAYFFWSTYDWKPRMQGAVFSLGPAVLAGVVMVPQMGWMNEQVLHGLMPHPGIFAWNFGWAAPMGLVLGHLIYGVTLGSLYTHPVGHSTNERIRISSLAAASRHRAPESGHVTGRASQALFASHLLYGLVLGLAFPFVHSLIQRRSPWWQAKNPQESQNLRNQSSTTTRSAS